jgi:hypothetical protein
VPTINQEFFRNCAARYLAQRHERRSLATMQIHVRSLLPHIGDLEPHQVHDATLAPFIASRVAAGASGTTINRTLEIVRAILNRAARSYRDSDGTPWLTGIPPLITMLPESRRSPYPITWAEQDRLFVRLPAHLQRGLHPIWVLRYRGRRIDSMNNTGGQNARRDEGLRAVRVHDLRHTFACRLRAAGVSAEDRSALLGHAPHAMSGHYASADVGRLFGRPISCSTVKRRARCCASSMAGRPQRPCAQPGPHWSHSNKRDLDLSIQVLEFGAAGRIRTHDPLVRSSADSAK